MPYPCRWCAISTPRPTRAWLVTSFFCGQSGPSLTSTRLPAIFPDQQGRQTSLIPSMSHILFPISTKDLPPLPKRTVQTCFVLPITSPRTLLQSILASSSSSTSPQTTTLSPLTRYRPCGCSVEGSSSPCSRMIRSIVSASTRFVTWSQETSVPVRVRPSTVRMRTFSVGLSAAFLGKRRTER